MEYKFRAVMKVLRPVIFLRSWSWPRRSWVVVIEKMGRCYRKMGRCYRKKFFVVIEKIVISDKL